MLEGTDHTSEALAWRGGG